MNDIKLINGSYYLYSDGTWSLIKTPTNRQKYLASLDENKRQFLLQYPEADTKGQQLDYEENAANTAKSKQTARQLIGTGLQLGGGIVGTMFAPQFFAPIWTGEGARNMMSDNGVKKTVQLAKGIDPDDSDVLQKLQEQNSKEGLTGKAITSGLGDALDASMAFGPILSNASNIAKAIPMIKKVEGSNFLSKLSNAAKINEELNKLAQNLGSKKVNPVLQASLPDNTISYQQAFRPSAKTILFGERPSTLTRAERLGIPKGERIPYTEQENIAFRKQINDFANKYGYEPIGEEVIDPEVLERYARSLIKRHNTFYRGTNIPKKGTEEYNYLIKQMGKSNPSEQEMYNYMSTHREGELYISPYRNISRDYGTSTEILRPYKLGSDRTKWFDEGNFTIYANGSNRTFENMEGFSGITSPWVSTDKGLGQIQTELTSWNQKFIPVKTDPRGVRESWFIDPIHWMHTTHDIERGSKNVPTVMYERKNGGKLNYLNYFK